MADERIPKHGFSGHLQMRKAAEVNETDINFSGSKESTGPSRKGTYNLEIETTDGGGVWRPEGNGGRYKTSIIHT